MSQTKKIVKKEQQTCSCNATPNECVKNVVTPVTRVQIIGDAFIIISSLNFETLKKIEKLHSNILCLKEYSKDEEKEIFRIGTGKTASISQYGITFTNANKEGKAIATMLFPAKVKDKREFIKENYAKALFMLEDLEDSIKNACRSIDKAYEKIDQLIKEI